MSLTPSLTSTSAAKSSLLPIRFPGNQSPLSLESKLETLPLYRFTIFPGCLLQVVIDRFRQFPDLPGVVISDVGCDRLLSRQQLLEHLLHTDQLAAHISIRSLLPQANPNALIINGNTAISMGAKQALNRPIEQQQSPILVQHKDQLCLLDAHTLQTAYQKIHSIQLQIDQERSQLQHLQNEKMIALGRLVDGLAHEILDPVGFIWGNLSYIASYTQQLSKLLIAYEAALPHPPESIIQLSQNIELDYLRSDLPAAIKSTQGGARRLKKLATSLQTFCHIDDLHPRPADINALIDNTLHLIKSRMATPVSVDRTYGKLPPIPCYAGQLSQVFLTLCTCAIETLLTHTHQIEEKGPNLSATNLKLTIETSMKTTEHLSYPDLSPIAETGFEKINIVEETQHRARWILITIGHVGSGLTKKERDQVLDADAVTGKSSKVVDLALSRQIITDKHKGRFHIRTGPANSTSTKFEIWLPLTDSH